MDGVEFMSELNIPANTVIVVIKLPYRLRDRWRAVASDIPETRHRRATFPDIVAFTERQVKLAVEPVSGSVQDAPKTMQSGPQRSLTTSHQGRSFATTATSVDGREVQVRNGHSDTDHPLISDPLASVCLQLDWACL